MAGRWTSLIILFVFLLAFGPIGCKTDSETKGTAVKTEKVTESEPEKKHDEEDKPTKEDEPDEGS